MKKIIVLFAALVWNICAEAQIQDTAKKFQPQNQSTNDSKYCAMLKDGKMTLMSEGKTVNAEINLSNGTKVSMEGTVTKSDGTKIVLENGECIDKDGNVEKP